MISAQFEQSLFLLVGDTCEQFVPRPDYFVIGGCTFGEPACFVAELRLHHITQFGAEKKVFSAMLFNLKSYVVRTNFLKGIDTPLAV